jgi:hypothetical protein
MYGPWKWRHTLYQVHRNLPVGSTGCIRGRTKLMYMTTSIVASPCSRARANVREESSRIPLNRLRHD